jgi:hypothetical protein
VILNLALAAILLSSTVANPLPQPGSYGFNWLDPASHCKRLASKNLASVSKCTISNNAFGLELQSYVCKVDSHTELVVYKTSAQCQEALETMQANGP